MSKQYKEKDCKYSI